ncbi:ArsR family transcriptional regulator [Mycobacterium gordonae]|uniref:ArsR family transcriptional regulator n=2 Tax=Mycobacteriaceae TaxID=1762 RepID=A0A1A6BN34_MYCGO|nr:ArsR family transcriptional regulator [Mycobacterium gordonae]ODR20328.1 ArsR family transcriptional regulator [Mycobacterium gordonae]ORV86302.1 ArsR family transcriptional regulator [Mycobacterium gordonae]
MAVAGKRRGIAPPALEMQDRSWTFLTNHAHVLLCLSTGEELTARELALRVGITERSVQAILTDLTAEGYLTKAKVGRRNVYEVNPHGRLRHPLEANHTVGELVAALS